MDPLGISRLARSDAPAARVTVAAGQEVAPRHLLARSSMGSSMAAAGAIRIHRPRPVCRSCLQRLLREVSSGGVSSHPGSGRCPGTEWPNPRSLDQSITRDGELPEHGVAATPSLPTPVGRGVRRGFRLVAAATATLRSLVATGQLPRLQELGASWRALPRDRDRLAAAEAWFRRQSFRYTLEPGPTGDFDAFLFDRQEGFLWPLRRCLRRTDAGCGCSVAGREWLCRWPQGGALGGPPYLDLR